MDRTIAKCIADKRLKEIFSDGEDRIRGLLEESEHSFIMESEVEYQLRADAFWDDKKKGVIRVNVTVDDQKFWSTFHPVCSDDLFTI